MARQIPKLKFQKESMEKHYWKQEKNGASYFHKEYSSAQTIRGWVEKGRYWVVQDELALSRGNGKIKGEKTNREFHMKGGVVTKVVIFANCTDKQGNPISIGKHVDGYTGCEQDTSRMCIVIWRTGGWKAYPVVELRHR